ncbi:MAG: bifunctional folylpolyglutamate synthase/dihydrofolate synthase [Alphaproteobacteria bacterium]|nr:bifunctional folylpolyglutamate synthase/dihydrofolate synthase [Alphaproteobacteria bacterium]MDA7983139.1 bifunctional folylpolyglutamate synthase/dihydrofolate synthase [Alphaproteobacteria bacterium]MDA7988966.1 bifunctional folylpolyglutamate synthase/dihydrofolate synthase [Alphaproteobacteria bacterium]MDA8009340.1 bifunctional folylpolyglutamate synthase/dihydrofolate synthase [Alphaproteobacteria bacterium]
MSDSAATGQSDRLLASFAELHPRRIDLSLGRIRRLLAALGNPERSLPPVAHVAGTNGKGSCLAFLRAIAREQGWRADCYISPHLARFHERIQIGGGDVGEARLARALRAASAANGGRRITYFEITTAAAFLIFAEAHARQRRDLLILEVGLGGRLDATNVVPDAVLSVISPVGRDHESFLGAGLESIAREKAGIMRARTAAVSAPQRAAARRALVARADALGAPLLLGGRDWSYREEAGAAGRSRVFVDCDVFSDLGRRVFRPGLVGPHQAVNAATSLVAARWLGASLDACARGVSRTRWPGRMQELRRGRLARRTGRDFSVWVDGAHNPDAARVLAEALGRLSGFAPWSFIAGMVAGKRCREFLRVLGGGGGGGLLVAVPVAGHESVDVEVLAGYARGLGFRAEAADSIEGAIDIVARLRSGDAAGTKKGVMICGSLYLVGEALKINDHPN